MCNKWRQTTSKSPVHSKMRVVVGDFSDTLTEQAASSKAVGRKRKHRTTADVHGTVSDTPKKIREHPQKQSISPRRSKVPSKADTDGNRMVLPSDTISPRRGPRQLIGVTELGALPEKPGE